MARVTESALIKMMLTHERTIKELENEFLSNEVDDPENKHLFLVDEYQQIEWTYMETAERYAKPKEVTIPSKMNIDNKYLRGTEKIIINKETGIFYFGYREAAESIAMKISTLSAMLNGQNKNTTNLIQA